MPYATPPASAAATTSAPAASAARTFSSRDQRSANGARTMSASASRGLRNAVAPRRAPASAGRRVHEVRRRVERLRCQTDELEEALRIDRRVEASVREPLGGEQVEDLVAERE